MSARSWGAVGALTLVAGGVAYMLAAPAPSSAPLVPAVADAPVPAAEAEPAETPTPAPAPAAPPAAPRAAPAEEPTPAPMRAPDGPKIVPPASPPGGERGERPESGLRTTDAFDHPDMREMDPIDERYDPVVEAQQRFHAYENAIAARAPMDRDTWTAVRAQFRPAHEAMLERSVELSQAGHGDESESLLIEWSMLESEHEREVQ